MSDQTQMSDQTPIPDQTEGSDPGKTDPAPTGAGLANAWTGPNVAQTPAATSDVKAVAVDDSPDTADSTEDLAHQSEESVEPEVLSEDDILAEEEPPYVSPYDRPGRWFVLHTQSGYEKKVKQNLQARIASMNMEERIYEVVIPTRETPEFKNGKKVITEKKLFPGYLLCRTRLDDDSWYVIRNTPGVTGFVNQGGKPSPMRRKDVENFLGVEADRTQEAAKRSKPMFEYGMGETVRVREGPFADFSGEIIEINEDQLRVKVLVNIFGRETPVELEFAQVARL
ncbi:MAG: transcription termination/antitermination factor NusG [Acidimicrobiaceae bacterium]|nr:transcription termination/antitermination factor NusG [Acidimicrobiaceae bacterium]MYD08248.1 transcription termination/antitermination factor NusG [Acidimicrobiaceae bacterium]MYI58731.1 transcription termination/antitermination factor NusG [Acidimicrobiaceae bacterium]